MTEKRRNKSLDDSNYQSDPKAKKAFTEMFAPSQLEQLEGFDFDDEILMKSGKAGQLAKGLSTIADMNNKTLNNYINSGRFVDVREGEVYVRTVLVKWIDLLKTLDERETNISRESKVPVASVRAVLKVVSNYLIGSGEQVIEEMDEYTERFIADVTGMRATLGSGAHKRGVSNRGTRK